MVQSRAIKSSPSQARLSVPTLYVVIPVYNEATTTRQCVKLVVSAPLPEGWSRTLVLIDDHSDNEGAAILKSLAEELANDGVNISLHRHEINRGKGAALHTGFDFILQSQTHVDDLVIIQDADLEYDPGDYSKLMEPIIQGRAQAVVGSRWGVHNQLQSIGRKLHRRGNGFISSFSNLMTGYQLCDMECCYKVFTIDVLRKLRSMLTENRFGIEPQMIASLSRLKVKIEQVPVSYDPRSVAAGKKIGPKDAARAIYVVLRERFRPIKKLRTDPNDN